MEGTDSAFFYTARAFGVNKTVISLTEYPLLDWKGRNAYMAAKLEERRTELYIGDLLWLLTKTKYELQSPSPTELELKPKRIDKRSAKEIKDGLLKRLGG